jgi:hypothetical protein
MNCPICGTDASKVIRTERGQKEDRRRHECACGVRWSTTERIERGTINTASNGGAAPPVIAPQASGNGGQTGELYSEIGVRSGNPDSKSGSSLLSDRERARSNEGAEFIRLLKVFCERWQRSNRRPYPVSAADKNQLGRFMKNNANYIESFADICDRYVSDRRQFIIDRSANHRLAWLVTTGLAMYGGKPRETLEQYSARTKREHEARKSDSRRPPASPDMRDLIAGLANQKAVG